MGKTTGFTDGGVTGMAKAWRKSPMPRGWARTRLRVLERDGYRCQIAGPRCTGRASHVDHAGGTNNHSLSALRAVCPTCHATRTGKQGAESKNAKYARGRPEEKHPGLLD